MISQPKGRRSRARQRVPRTRLSCEVSRRASSHGFFSVSHTTTHHNAHTPHHNTRHNIPQHTTTARPQHHTKTETERQTERERDRERRRRQRREEKREERRERRRERREKIHFQCGGAWPFLVVVVLFILVKRDLRLLKKVK